MARYLADRTGMQVLGVDRSERFVQVASNNPAAVNVRFEVMDFTRPDQILGRRFDYVVGNGILHHLYDDLAQSLQAMRNLLITGGRIVFLEPNLDNPYVYLVFTRPTLRRLAKLEPDEMAFSRRFAIPASPGGWLLGCKCRIQGLLASWRPKLAIRPLVTFGEFAESTPGLKHLAQ